MTRYFIFIGIYVATSIISVLGQMLTGGEVNQIYTAVFSMGVALFWTIETKNRV